MHCGFCYDRGESCESRPYARHKSTGSDYSAMACILSTLCYYFIAFCNLFALYYTHTVTSITAVQCGIYSSVSNLYNNSNVPFQTHSLAHGQHIYVRCQTRVHFILTRRLCFPSPFPRLLYNLLLLASLAASTFSGTALYFRQILCDVSDLSLGIGSISKCATTPINLSKINSSSLTECLNNLFSEQSTQ